MSPPHSDLSESRRLAAVWFADIVGYTALSTGDEPLALLIVEVLQTASRNAAERHGGTVVKFLGDGVLAQFRSAEGAARAALQLQLRFQQLTEGWTGGPHQLRIGVHLGDVVVRPDGDIMGDGVNRASRLEGLAEPGQILVSEEVRRQLRRRPDMQLTDCGTRTAKGIDEPIKVYQVEAGEELAASLLAAAAGQHRPKERKQRTRAIAVGMAVGILSFISLGVWTALGGSSGSTVPAHDSHADSFSVAVLPFQYLSSDQADAYLADGVSGELIHGLSTVPGLRVASRTSSFQYRDAEMDVGILAKRLGVFLIVEGSVQKMGDNLRITAQLTDADHAIQLWSERWDTRTENILDVQQEIAEAVVAVLLGQAAAEAGLTEYAEARPGDEAYQFLLRGRHAMTAGTRESLTQAVEYCEEALVLAPTSPEAHLAMGRAQLGLASVGARPMAQALPQVRGHLDEALRLDPDMPEAHAELALLLATYEWDWEGAEREFEASLAQAPTTSARRAYATFLSARGRYDEALGQLDLAFHLEPGAVPSVAARGLVLFRAARYLQARVVLNEAVRLAPGHAESLVLLARTHVELGSPDTALELLSDEGPGERDALVRLWNAQIRMASSQGQPQAREGLFRGMQETLDSSLTRSPDTPYYMASLSLALGDRTGAIESLRRAFEARSPSLMWLPTDPVWEPLQTSPDFQRMVEQIDSGS